MTIHDIRRGPKGRWQRDDAAQRESTLHLGRILTTLLTRLDADQGIDTADLVEELTQWREQQEKIDTRRGEPSP